MTIQPADLAHRPGPAYRALADALADAHRRRPPGARRAAAAAARSRVPARGHGRHGRAGLRSAGAARARRAARSAAAPSCWASCEPMAQVKDAAAIGDGLIDLTANFPAPVPAQARLGRPAADGEIGGRAAGRPAALSRRGRSRAAPRGRRRMARASGARRGARAHRPHQRRRGRRWPRRCWPWPAPAMRSWPRRCATAACATSPAGSGQHLEPVAMDEHGIAARGAGGGRAAQRRPCPGGEPEPAQPHGHPDAGRAPGRDRRRRARARPAAGRGRRLRPARGRPAARAGDAGAGTHAVSVQPVEVPRPRPAPGLRPRAGRAWCARSPRRSASCRSAMRPWRPSCSPAPIGRAWWRRRCASSGWRWRERQLLAARAAGRPRPARRSRPRCMSGCSLPARWTSAEAALALARTGVLVTPVGAVLRRPGRGTARAADLALGAADPHPSAQRAGADCPRAGARCRDGRDRQPGLAPGRPAGSRPA